VYPSGFGSSTAVREQWPASCCVLAGEYKAMARKRQTSIESPDETDIIEEKDEVPGPVTAGQAGDTQDLPDLPEADSESVAELVAEGQYFEAAVVSGVENAPDPDVAEVTTREVPADDVPPEYLEREQD